MKDNVAKEFIEQINYRLEESTRMIKISLEQVVADDIWKRFNDSSNSIGNLMLHLCGNITQYIIASLGNAKDIRERDVEFNTRGGYSKEELFNTLVEVVNNAKIVLSNCETAELLRKREVQGFHFSGIGIAIHVAEHYSYHTGQIALIVKQLKNKELGFYDGMNLNTKNEG